MTWTAEQEASLQDPLSKDMPHARRVALTKLDRHCGAIYMGATWESVVQYLGDHGAELIELIRPFVKDKT